MPGHILSWSGIVGLILMVVAVAALVAVSTIEPDLWVVPTAALFLSAMLLIFDRGRLSAGTATLGGLARRVAALNFGRFAKMGAGTRDTEIWGALIELLSEHSLIAKSNIRPNTLLIREE
jgi:hypothetical protein